MTQNLYHAIFNPIRYGVDTHRNVETMQLVSYETNNYGIAIYINHNIKSPALPHAEGR